MNDRTSPSYPPGHDGRWTGPLLRDRVAVVTGGAGAIAGATCALFADQGADIVVVDKPHFLATMPRGRHVTQTVVVRLRRELDLPELSPAHRLDRLTAGVLLLTTMYGFDMPFRPAW